MYKHLNLETPGGHTAPSFRQIPAQQQLRDELKAFLTDVWTAENAASNNTLQPQSVYDSTRAFAARARKRSLLQAVPRFRQLTTSDTVDDLVDGFENPLLAFEMDADSIAAIFNESLAAAVAPCETLDQHSPKRLLQCLKC